MDIKLDSTGAERAVISACHHHKKAARYVCEALIDEDFANKNNRDIFNAIKLASINDEPISSEFLAKYKIDVELFEEIIRNQMAPVDLVPYIRHLKSLRMREGLRELQNNMTALVSDYSKSLDEIAEEISSEVHKITRGLSGEKLKDVKLSLGNFTLALNEQMLREGQPAGLFSGFSELDAKTTGLKPGELIIIAARPGMGKTTLALNIANAVMQANVGSVAIFSLEMSDVQVMQKLISARTYIPLQDIMQGTFYDQDACMEQIHSVAKSMLDSYNLYIYDEGVINIAGVKSELRRLATKCKDLKLAVIDYIGLMETGSKYSDRHLQIAEISRGLKMLARELNIPIIALSQLNRELEKRSNKRPMMSDLRESGAIEQDADTILFIYNDEFYREQAIKEARAAYVAEKGSEAGFVPKYQLKGSNEPQDVEIIIAKNRFGSTGTVNVLFEKQYSLIRPQNVASEQTFEGAEKVNMAASVAGLGSGASGSDYGSSDYGSSSDDSDYASKDSCELDEDLYTDYGSDDKDFD